MFRSCFSTTSAAPTTSTWSTVTTSSHKNDKGKSIALSNLALSIRLQILSQALQAPLQSDEQCIPAIATLLVHLPEWPQDRVLSIVNKKNEEIVRAVPPHASEKLPAIKLLLDENAYAGFANNDSRIVPIEINGDNFYNAILTSLRDKVHTPYYKWITTTATANDLRDLLKQYISTHPSEVEHLLNRIYTPEIEQTTQPTRGYLSSDNFSSTPRISLSQASSSSELQDSATLAHQSPRPSTSSFNILSREPDVRLFRSLFSSFCLSTADTSTALPKISATQNKFLYQTNTVLPSIYAIPCPPTTLQKKIFHIMKAYQTWFLHLSPDAKNTPYLFIQEKINFLNTHRISWTDLDPYIKINGCKKILGKQLELKIANHPFSPITVGVLKQCITYFGNKKISALRTLSQFAQTQNIFRPDLEKLCNKNKFVALTLYGEQALDLFAGKIFRPITTRVVEKFLKSLQQKEGRLNPYCYLAKFCRQKNILLEQFERYLISNRLLIDDSNLLERYELTEGVLISTNRLPHATAMQAHPSLISFPSSTATLLTSPRAIHTENSHPSLSTRDRCPSTSRPELVSLDEMDLYAIDPFTPESDTPPTLDSYIDLYLPPASPTKAISSSYTTRSPEVHTEISDPLLKPALPEASTTFLELEHGNLSDMSSYIDSYLAAPGNISPDLDLISSFFADDFSAELTPDDVENTSAQKPK